MNNLYLELLEEHAEHLAVLIVDTQTARSSDSLTPEKDEYLDALLAAEAALGKLYCARLAWIKSFKKS